MPLRHAVRRTLTAVATIVAALTTFPRTSAAQAAKPAPPWWPSAGAVILAGGGMRDDTAIQLEDRLIALAGGPDAVIVIVPTAWDRLPARLPAAGAEPADVAGLRKRFEARGARHVVMLHTRDRRVANTEDFVKVLRTAKAVFFTGGRSRVLDDTYHGTLFEREVRAVLARGGVLVGDSAGAITLGCAWLGWASATSDFGPISQGLCALPNVAVTPHVRARGNNKMVDEIADSLFRYVVTHPPTIGINIEENTFVVFKGSTAQVFGAGAVLFLDAAKDRTRPYLRLTPGAPHDLGM